MVLWIVLVAHTPDSTVQSHVIAVLVSIGALNLTMNVDQLRSSCGTSILMTIRTETYRRVTVCWFQRKLTLELSWNFIKKTADLNRPEFKKKIMKIIPPKNENKEIKISKRLWVVIIHYILIDFLKRIVKTCTIMYFFKNLSCTGKQRAFGQLQSSVWGSLLWRRK